MQENNNFETIITTWRRLSGEQVETAIVSMSGDSQPYKKEKPEVDLLLPERSRGQMAVTSSSNVAVADAASDTRDLEKIDENQEFLKQDKEKDGGGDGNEKKSMNEDDYIENKEPQNNFPGTKYEKESGDKVDSVFIRPPVPQKTLSPPPPEEEEECGIKCLYYTLQCCDCVLM